MKMSNYKKRVAIVGGGITGLAAAFYLQKEMLEKNLPIEITLIESSNRLGGKIQTFSKDGFTIERGPDSFLERKQSASKLIREVGLGDKLINNATGTAYILLKGKLHPIPEGAVMGIPTKLSPFITTGLFSPLGKARAAADLVLPSGKVEGDQSLGSFFRRRLGDEVVDNLIEPLLSGIYAGDIDRLSLRATFPQFQQVEKKYRSLILGLGKTMPKPKTNRVGDSPKKGMFQTVSTGLESLVDAIEAKLNTVTVLKAVKVMSITGVGPYTLRLSNGEISEFDSLIVTTPHYSIEKLFIGFDWTPSISEMTSTSVATVAMAFDEEVMKENINGTGFVVSRKSDYTITACTWTHKKWPHSTPAGKVLLRAYVGRVGDEAIVDQSDDEIKRVVLDDLNKIMRINVEPDFTLVSRWKNAMPQYNVGHKERIGEWKKIVANHLPGVFLAGSSFDGLGLPDCINQGVSAVGDVVEFLGKIDR